jgi:hypothetical protein
MVRFDAEISTLVSGERRGAAELRAKYWVVQ